MESSVTGKGTEFTLDLKSVTQVTENPSKVPSGCLSELRRWQRPLQLTIVEVKSPIYSVIAEAIIHLRRPSL